MKRKTASGSRVGVCLKAKGVAVSYNSNARLSAVTVLTPATAQGGYIQHPSQCWPGYNSAQTVRARIGLAEQVLERCKNLCIVSTTDLPHYHHAGIPDMQHCAAFA